MPGSPEIIKKLVETFQNNIDSFKSGSYNETQVRREFIDPFFTALGWDVDNKAGYAEAYKDVIHEFSLKTKDITEAPDYCFRIGGTKKFFVEAKKPSVNLRDDIHPSFQLRRYAWTAKLPLSILTDFEEFAVYDCRIPPNKNDKASAARIMFLTFEDYIEKWDEIESVFSREAVLKGSFDKYVESNKKKKGTAEVDDVFLDQMEEWRKFLAKNIALRNPSLTIRELNYAVQKTIDRIIFLRICEDRGIEDYGQLMNLLNGTNCYERLKQIYLRADEKYNSGLFHFEVERDRTEPPDNLTLDLSIDDKTLKDVIRNLYYPDSPYEFSVLPADILGQVYEQFLGKVIRLTPAHFAVIEDKPEVKKAGGVYYTPTYIVDYIVNNTVGKVIENKTPKQISKITILDPACGSGSFLIGAYQYLLTYHEQYYNQQLKDGKLETGRRNSPVYEAYNGEIRLTTSEKKRILLNNIYGVDIDSQAVEVTKLSLLLKVLEGETDETLTNQMKMFRERALPDLSNNIKCGNSLIGPDFYDQMEMNFLDDEEKLRINVFDWKSEFKEIMNEGGFDVVIGNPPYRMVQPHNTSKEELNFYQQYFKVASFKIDLYHLFIERGIDLLSEAGLLGFIVPSPILNNVYAEKLRSHINHKTEIKILALPNEKVFKDADVVTIVQILQKSNEQKENNILLTTELEKSKLNLPVRYSKIKQIHIGKSDGDVWNLLLNEGNLSIINKIKSAGINLEKIARINRGLITGDREKYFSNKKENQNYHPILSGSDVQRYFYNEPSEFINFVRPKSGGGCWDKEMHFSKHKIIIRQIGKEPTTTLITSPYAITGNIFSIMADSLENEKIILGIINSKLINYFWQILFTDFKTSFPQVTIFSLSQIPIIVFNAASQTTLERLINSVETMLQLNSKMNSIKTPAEKTALQRQIEATDKQIDQLVYQLYGLTEEEIRIVEDSIK